MVGLVTTAKKLTQQKLELGKIRRSSEKEFKKAKSISRKYSSSLTSLEKRVNFSREQAEDLGQILSQKIAQIESKDTVLFIWPLIRLLIDTTRR